jgi:polyhydroxyalkanoate synthesis regulator phasin
VNQVATDLILAFFASVFGFAASLVTNRRAKRTETRQSVIDSGKLELEGRRVAGEAYAQAQKINQDVVNGLHRELESVRQDLETERAGRAEDNRRHAAELGELRGLVEKLRTELDVTRAQLRIPSVPAPKGDEG